MTCVLCVCLAGAAVAETVSERLVIEQPRGFGYLLGDKFRRVVHLDLRQPYTLVDDRLPKAGRFTDWLTLETPQVEVASDGEVTRYRLEFTYQILNVSAAFNDIAVPHHYLVYGNGEETLQALVPATRVLVSPVDIGRSSELRPAHAPKVQPIDRTRGLFAGTLLLFGLGALAYVQWGWAPFSSARPFSAASRQAGRLGDADDPRYGVVLQAVHHAFNITAGRTVFAETLDDFFLEHSRFVAAREPIEHYFTHSRQFFYANDSAAGDVGYSVDDLKHLLRHLGDLERGIG